MKGLKRSFVNSRPFVLIWKHWLKLKSKFYHSQIEFFGNDQAGWYIYPDLIDESSIVYSFGVGNDISFDLAINKRFGCYVNLFDPTPAVKEWILNCQIPVELKFYDYGLSDSNEEVFFYPPRNSDHVSHSEIYSDSLDRDQKILVEMRTIDYLMDELQNNHIDLLKLDIEGSEYRVIDYIVENKIPIDQILVEFHHRFSSFSFEHTMKSIKSLKKEGYKILSVSKNGNDYLFVKRNQ